MRPTSRLTSPRLAASCLASGASPACAVCSSADARTLSSTALESGAVVIVCGSHALAHSRGDRPARTVHELVAMLGERREASRRGAYLGEVDELAEALSSGFTPERRLLGRRGRDATA